jgi:DivIVA domain-containing protein
VEEILAPGDLRETLKRRGRGYDRGEVDAHLARVVASYQRLWGERNALQKELEQFRGHERILRETLATAQRTADEAMAKAEKKAARLVGDARKEADKLLLDARLGAVRLAAEKEQERAKLESEIERLGALRQEAEMTLQEFVAALVDVIGDQERDLQAALAVHTSPTESATVEHAQALAGEAGE